MSLTEAEITKLASNTYETMRVSFVNMIAQISNEIGNTNVDKITSALTFRFERRFSKVRHHMEVRVGQEITLPFPVL